MNNMTKQDYLNTKQNNQYNIEMLYEFWNKNKKANYKDLKIEEFAILIQDYASAGGNFNQEKLEKYFDSKFNITKVFDKNNNLIKEM